MTHRFLHVLCGLLAVATPASPQQTEWKDPRRMRRSWSRSTTDVQLEVLDWGGSGPALVLLAGLELRRTSSTTLRRH